MAQDTVPLWDGLAMTQRSVHLSETNILPMVPLKADIGG